MIVPPNENAIRMVESFISSQQIEVKLPQQQQQQQLNLTGDRSIKQSEIIFSSSLSKETADHCIFINKAALDFTNESIQDVVQLSTQQAFFKPNDGQLAPPSSKSECASTPSQRQKTYIRPAYSSSMSTQSQKVTPPQFQSILFAKDSPKKYFKNNVNLSKKIDAIFLLNQPPIQKRNRGYTHSTLSDKESNYRSTSIPTRESFQVSSPIIFENIKRKIFDQTPSINTTTTRNPMNATLKQSLETTQISFRNNNYNSSMSRYNKDSISAEKQSHVSRPYSSTKETASRKTKTPSFYERFNEKLRQNNDLEIQNNLASLEFWNEDSANITSSISPAAPPFIKKDFIQRINAYKAMKQNTSQQVPSNSRKPSAESALSQQYAERRNTKLNSTTHTQFYQSGRFNPSLGKRGNQKRMSDVTIATIQNQTLMMKECERVVSGFVNRSLRGAEEPTTDFISPEEWIGSKTLEHKSHVAADPTLQEKQKKLIRLREISMLSDPDDTPLFITPGIPKDIAIHI